MDYDLADDVGERLARIEERLDLLERLLTRTGLQDEQSSARELSPSIRDLLNLPDTLRRTLLALQGLGEATSQEVAVKTGRTRSIETVYLNQLSRLKYVARKRRSRKIYYTVSRYY